MGLTQLSTPYPVFTDKDGRPLDNGYVYFGTVYENPETSPVQVYYDPGLTQLAPQPLRTSNGYIMRNGSPAILYAADLYSVTLRDKNGSLIITAPAGYGVSPYEIAGPAAAEVVIVSGIAGDVTDVAAIKDDVVTVADIGSSVITVSGIATSVVDVALISTEVAAVGAIAEEVVIAADNVEDITNFADVYYGPSPTGPVARRNGDPLLAGDLFFDTTDDRMNNFTGAGWGPISSGGVARTFYVSMTGDNQNDGTSSSAPLATINEGLTRAAVSGQPNIVIVHPGEYEVQPDTVFPKDCALYGYDLRVTKLYLPAGQEVNNMFLMTSGMKVRGFTMTGLMHDPFTFDPTTDTFIPPTKGFAFAFNPGEIIIRSPYISDCSVLHNLTQQQLVLPIDRLNGNPDMPLGQGNILADGSVLDADSPLRSVVVDSFTAINPNGVGYLIQKNAFIQLVSVFTNWSRIGLWSNTGGQMTVVNSNNTFGDYALAATGFRHTIEIPDSDPADLAEYDADATYIDDNFDDIIANLAVRYSTLPGMLPIYDDCASDSATLLRAIANDLRSGQDRAMEYATKGYFGYNANLLVDPALVPLFVLCWDEIYAELASRLPTPAAITMVRLLLDIPTDVLTDVAANGTNSQYAFVFTSRIEANGQQFSNVGAGVNYNSLPASQRGTGNIIDPTQGIIEVDGGVVYATFSTEEGDTYLGKDLRIDFQRSTIEGQAFSRGVQNIALPLIIGIGG